MIAKLRRSTSLLCRADLDLKQVIIRRGRALRQPPQNINSRVQKLSATKKVGLPLGTGSPEKARSIVSVVFTPTRGVIHPSFPLRGRWERFAKNGEQAPSPSLTTSYISSCKNAPTHPTLANARPTPCCRTAQISSFLSLPSSFGPIKLCSKSANRFQFGTP